MMQLVYLSPVPWSSFSQRPHKFVEWFQSKTGGHVLWIDPYPTRLPVWDDIGRRRDGATLEYDAPANGITVIRPRAFPIEPLPASGVINRLLWTDIFEAVEIILSKGPTILGIGKPSEMALRLLSAGKFERSFYDAMDDFPAFYNGLSRAAMAKRENLTVDGVSKVWVSSTQLFARWGEKKNVSLVRNACDVEMLPSVDEILKPKPHEILGYVGTIGQWFDWELVFSIARARPTTQVRLIGPVFSPAPDSLPENVEVLPPCAHDAAIAAMQEFNVGLIPFKQTRLTESVDPIKYYEYRALGLPVISSSFGEMRFHKNESGVFRIDQLESVNEVNTLIDVALTYQAEVSEIHAFRENNSWEARFAGTGLLV